jgi:polyferredoxin
MDKMQYPRGLVRYDTQNGLEGQLGPRELLRRMLRPRVLGYGAVLLLICVALLTSLWLRAPFKVDVVRDRGSIARQVEDGWIENVYRLQIMNTTEQAQRYRVSPRGLPQLSADLAGDIVVAPAEARWVPVTVRVPPQVAESAGPGAHGIEFVVERIADTADEPSRIQVEKSTFLVPR